MKKQDKELYETGIKRQKQGGWAMIIIGGLLTLTLIGAIIGIPLIVVGIYKIKSKDVDAINGFIVRQQIRKKY